MEDARDPNINLTGYERSAAKVKANYMLFKTYDSGKREEFPTGMVRDTQDGKPRYDLIYKPLLRRWAELMARGAVKYGDNNWTKAETIEEMRRFIASAERHMEEAVNALKCEMNDRLGRKEFYDEDRELYDRTKGEDHMAAVIFNLAGMELVASKQPHAAPTPRVVWEIVDLLTGNPTVWAGLSTIEASTIIEASAFLHALAGRELPHAFMLRERR